jgi:hypothetical protein
MYTNYYISEIGSVSDGQDVKENLKLWFENSSTGVLNVMNFLSDPVHIKDKNMSNFRDVVALINSDNRQTLNSLKQKLM